MKKESLRDLLIDELKDTYDAEHQIVETLPKMQKVATSPELKAAFQQHLAETQAQIIRLEQVFQALGEEPKRKTCKAMKGLIAEGTEVMEEHAGSDVLDAAMIASAQRIEHYEIAAYGTNRTFAYLLGEQQAAQLLQQTLDEEEMTDKKLTQIAGAVNLEAM